jgi:5-methylcytosine-specific restriction protein B
LKAIEWLVPEKHLKFEVIFDDLKLFRSDFVALKFFEINKDLIKDIENIIDAKKLFKLNIISTEDAPLNINNYTDKRKILLFDNKSKVRQNSDSLQLYQLNGNWVLYKEVSFISSELIKLFVDYTKTVEKRKKLFLATVKKTIEDKFEFEYEPSEFPLFKFYNIFISIPASDKTDKTSRSKNDDESPFNEEDDSDTSPLNSDTSPLNEASNSNIIKMPLNQILYGPPGTGKTYHTIYKALEIIGLDLTKKDRKTSKDIFDEYVKKGQIVFTTFHQSMNYEDFIEGIKPVEIKGESESLSYKVEAGIFKKLAITAAFEIAKAKNLENTIKIHDFSSQYDHYINVLDEKLLTGQRVRVKSRTNGDISIDNISQNRNIIVKHLEGARTYTVSKERLMKLNKAFPDLESVQNIHIEFQEVIGGANMSAYWAILNDIRQNASQKVEKQTHFTWEEQVQVVSEMQKADFVYSNTRVQPSNFVLIIDEINRGNVSQIFGELITLMEEDKRLGKEEALQITLPYSKQSFGIPQNLYIIGNMNTADRSVEALDTALRRRFVFEEMMPKPELLKTVEGIDLSKLLKVINERIEVLLNRDNLIGHSYFLNIASLEDLKKVFFNNIIPLLQEYFYGDYGKIGLVFGNGFVKLKPSTAKFAKFDYDNDFSDKKVYEIIPNTNDFDIANALKLLLNE